MKLYALPLCKDFHGRPPGEIFHQEVFGGIDCLLYPLCADGERRVP